MIVLDQEFMCKTSVSVLDCFFNAIFKITFLAILAQNYLTHILLRQQNYKNHPLQEAIFGNVPAQKLCLKSFLNNTGKLLNAYKVS